MKNFKNKVIISIVVIGIIINLTSISSAYEIEEEINDVWIQEEISNASASATHEPNIISKNIAVLDRESKTVLYGKNENNRTKMASTTKIMTAIVLLENLNKNNLTLNDEVEVCKQAANIGGSRLGLKTGDKITINDLLYGLMLCSRKRRCNANSRKYFW